MIEIENFQLAFPFLKSGAKNVPVTHVGVASLDNWVVVDIDNLVQVPGDNFGDLFESIKVELLGRSIDKLVDSDRSQITNGNLKYYKIRLYIDNSKIVNN